MSISGSFSLAFDLDFDYYSGVLPTGVLSAPLLGYYIFNKKRKYHNVINNYYNG